ncbi:YolD-like family protein [Lysinibacillus fusiformis]|uniref:YolD-like family protein n=1 Tax=Lysinibacillus fusiformis TaxID=28031 RepID=UPI0035C04ED9|nr:YolD-like family protein [Lysinibacillus fusiformis]
MIRDRGTIKWTAMMLPEHVQKIKQWKREAYAEAPRTLSEWELEDLQQTINQAFNQHKTVTISTWQEAKYVQWTGTITALEESQQLVLETLTAVKRIPFHSIHTAHLEDESYD